MSTERERQYSFVVPVYNRPDEIDELLGSMTRLMGEIPFEVIVVEDGSSRDCRLVAERYIDRLNLRYLHKYNSGPGDSRNFGMRHAQGNYFLILDSDCVLPPQYLCQVESELQKEYVHCFGGPDRGHKEDSPLQKSVNFSMTSVLTTGGIRGRRRSVDSFQPRSFNMGLSEEAFRESGGFGDIHPGEDPDLVLRLWHLGYRTRLFPDAWVYHKRRVSFRSFLRQVYLFGLARPVLNSWHPGSSRLYFWLPTLFLMGSLFGLMEWIGQGSLWLLRLYGLYFLVSLFSSMWVHRSIAVGILTLPVIVTQFFGYGWGFLKSSYLINFRHQLPEKAVPELFRFKSKRIG